MDIFSVCILFLDVLLLLLAVHFFGQDCTSSVQVIGFLFSQQDDAVLTEVQKNVEHDHAFKLPYRAFAYNMQTLFAI